MISRCGSARFDLIYEIINDAAQAYKGVIPEDCYKEPYMSRGELAGEIAAGVVFYGYEAGLALAGVMGIQQMREVSLIRHAYVRTASQKRGIGGKLLTFMLGQTDCPLLVGTWADAAWAVRFYEKHGFQLVFRLEKERLLRKYWSISERQIETSVVLADQKWLSRRPGSLQET